MTNRTFRHFTLLTLFTGLCALMFSLTGCGGGSASFSYGSPGPADGSSLSGTTVSINPTIQFLAGGVVSYQNVESNSQFPASSNFTAGTYVYAPGSDYKTGVLTITLGAPLNTSITLNITDFGAANGNVKAFKVSYNGTTYTGNVTSGNMVAYVASSGGGGSTGGGTVNNPPVLGGSLTLSMSAVEVNRFNSTYTTGQLMTFGIASTSLTLGGTTLLNPTVQTIDLTQKNYIFTDASSGLKYSVAFNGGAFNNQIVVLNQSDTFVAAFAPAN